MTRKRDKSPKGQPPKEAKVERAHSGSRAPYTFAFKLRVVKLVEEPGVTQLAAARSFGLSSTSVNEWVRAYRQGREDALRPSPRFEREPSIPDPDPYRDPVVALREQHPQMGTRRIRDVLARFEALGVSEKTMKRQWTHARALLFRDIARLRAE